MNGSASAIALLAIVAAACATDADSRARNAGDSPTEQTLRSSGWCWDSIETRALACSHQSARRSGDTLHVRLAGGREMPFVDDPVGEAPGGYHYYGRVTRPPLQVVQEYGHETAPTWIFVSERTGASVVASDEPVISPDSSRFVTAAQPDWDNCSERDRPSLDVWRFTDTLPVLEWRLAPWDCRRQQGWGPTDPRWRGPDTLEFTRNELRVTAPREDLDAHRQTGRGLAVRAGGGWHVVTP